ncbi:MAG: hypothetical protein IPP72_16900 [Chitinophagaceae bacterium]|nr:hypothetical protein [Chitinophagaceae bacterium]
MNTYNDNLRNNVIATLSTMELELKAMQSEANAAMFSYYYALGATINETEKLVEDKAEMEFREQVKNEAVKVNNLSNNNLNSANQAGQCVKQSVSNVSINANNVQVAANAILQLAGDIGDFKNMATAADRYSNFQTLAVTVNEYISTTAHNAELASQLAMEASMYTSKISAPTVLSNAKGTNTAVNKLLNAVIGDYTAMAQIVSSDQLALATLSAKEHLAGGVYADCQKENKAVLKGYVEANEQVNLALRITTNAAKNPSAFTVAFKLFKSPFHETPLKGENANIYPVQDYYLFVVKEEKQFTFSHSVAENIIDQNKSQQFIDLAADINQLAPHDSFKKTYDFKQMNLCDSDGDDIIAGSRYVVFLMAKLWEDYKIKLNTFENFLSAPSTAFYFTTLMPQVNIPVFVIPSPGLSRFDFSVSESEDIHLYANPFYRINFLPVASTNPHSLQQYNSIFLIREIVFAESKSSSSISNKLPDYETKLAALKKANPETMETITGLQKNEPLWAFICNELLHYYGKDNFSLDKYPILADTPEWIHQNSREINDWIKIAGVAIDSFGNEENVFFADPDEMLMAAGQSEMQVSWLGKIKEEGGDVPVKDSNVFFQIVYLMAFVQAGKNVQAMLDKNLSQLTTGNVKCFNGVVACYNVLVAESDSRKSMSENLTRYAENLKQQESDHPAIVEFIKGLQKDARKIWAFISNEALRYYGKDKFSLENYPVLADTAAWLLQNIRSVNESITIANTAIENFNNDENLFFAGPADSGMAASKNEIVMSLVDKIKKQDSGLDTSVIEPDAFFNIVYLMAFINAGQNVIAMLENNALLLQSFMKSPMELYAETCLQKKLSGQLQTFTGFSFDVALAQQVSSANYTTASTRNLNQGKLEGSCSINDATTDNFGTVLLPDIYYIPAVLSIADIDEENPQAPTYTSVLTFGMASKFTPPANNNHS